MTQGVPGEDEMTSRAGQALIDLIRAALLQPEVAKLIGGDGKPKMVALVELELIEREIAAIEQEIRDDIRARVEALRIHEHTIPETDQYVYRPAVLRAISSSSATEHVHEWEDAPDDETGWHCPGCGVTEYPGMKDDLTPNEFVEPSSATETQGLTHREQLAYKAGELAGREAERLGVSATETQDGERLSPADEAYRRGYIDGERNAANPGTQDGERHGYAEADAPQRRLRAPTPDDRDREVERIAELENALRLAHQALRDRERKAGKTIASDVALYAHATLEGLRMEPGLAARIAGLRASGGD